VYKFEQWIDKYYPEKREEYKQDNTNKSFWDWINYKHLEIIHEWRLFLGVKDG